MATKQIPRIILTLIIITAVLSLTGDLNTQEALAGGEANVDSFDVHPEYRWDEAEDGGSIGTVVEQSQMNITAYNSSLYSTNRRLQKTKDKIEAKVKIPTTNSQVNIGLRKDNPSSVDTEQNYYFTDPDSDLVAHWNMDTDQQIGANDYIDLSGNGHDIDFKAYAVNYHPSYTGYAEECIDLERGSSQYGIVQDHDDFSFIDSLGDKPFSFELWLNLESIGIYQDVITKYKDVNGEREYRMFIYSVDNKMQIKLYDIDNSAINIYLRTNKVFEADVWYHIVFTYDGSETHGGMNLYIDGVLDGSTTGEAGNYVGMSNTVHDFEIGRYDATNYFDGKIDDVKIHSKELSSDEILRYYHEGRPEEVAYYKMNEGSGSNIYDSAENSHGGVISNAVWADSSVDSEYYSCLDFVRTDQVKVTVSDHDDFSFGNTTAFSVEAWIYFETSDSNWRYIVSKYKTTDDNREWALVNPSGYGSSVAFFLCHNGIYTTRIGRISSSLAINQWHHIFASYNGNQTSNGISIYVNGVVDNNAYYQADETNYGGMINGDADLEIGTTASNYFNGKIDEVHIYEKSYSETEIAYRYANYSSLLIQNRIEKEIPTCDTDGNTVRIVFEREYLSGNTICYAAFETYDNETIKSASQVVQYYDKIGEEDSWLIVELSYDTKKTYYKFEVEFLNGTEILDLTIADFSNEIPSISNHSQFFCYYSFILLEKTYSEFFIDYIKCSFKEQEWKLESATQGNPDVNYQGFYYDSSVGANPTTENWILDVPYFDSCSGTISFSVYDIVSWRDSPHHGYYIFDISTVNPYDGTLTDLNMGFDFILGEVGIPGSLPGATVGADWTVWHYITWINMTTDELEFSYNLDKTNHILNAVVVFGEYLLSGEYEFDSTEIVPNEFLLEMSVKADPAAGMGGGDYLSMTLNEWNLISRDLFADLMLFVPGLGEAAETIGDVGNLLVVLIRAISSLIESTLDSVGLLSNVLLAVTAIFSLVGGISTTLTNLPSTIYNQFSSILNTINTGIGTINTSITGLPALIFGQFSAILNTINTGIGTLDTSITGLPASIFGQFNAILNTIDTSITGLPGLVWAQFSTVLNDIDTALGNIPTAIWNQFSSILSDIDTALGGLPSSIFSAFETLVTDIFDEIAALAADIYSQFETILNTIITTISGVAVAVIDQLILLIEDLWDAIVIFLVDIIQDIIDATQSVVGEFGAFLSWLFNWWLVLIFPTDVYDWIIGLAGIVWDEFVIIMINLWDLTTKMAIFVWLILTFYIFTWPFLVNEFRISDSIEKMAQNFMNTKGVTLLGFYIGVPCGVYWLVLMILLGYWSWFLPFEVI